MRGRLSSGTTSRGGRVLWRRACSRRGAKTDFYLSAQLCGAVYGVPYRAALLDGLLASFDGLVVLALLKVGS